jgi:hypothetical protein
VRKKGDGALIETVGIVLWFHGISASQDAVEKELDCSVQWIGPMRDGSQSAQIDLTSGDYLIHWDAVILAVERLSGGITRMIGSGAIAKAELDVGLPFHFPRNLASSITIPAEMCVLAGRSGIAIEVTHYATPEDDETSS